jgi:pimeloyl-ACP methyl ester carboxylesterase
MTTRRDLLAQAASLGGVITASSADALGGTRSNGEGRTKVSRNFVLVHGAWHGGWCYRRVADLIRAQGHHVETPTLTGLGERSHLAGFQINCSTHIQDVVNVIRWERLEDVILCGHSYGGMVIGGVADAIPQTISAVVYLDCPLPENAKSAFDLVPQAQARLVAATAEYGGFLVKPPAAKAFDVNAADQDMVDALLTPHPLASLCEPLKLTGAYMRIVRKIYVQATSGHYPAPVRIKEDPDWKVVDVTSGHDIMIDAPAAVANVLLSTV